MTGIYNGHALWSQSILVEVQSQHLIVLTMDTLLKFCSLFLIWKMWVIILWYNKLVGIKCIKNVKHLGGFCGVSEVKASASSAGDVGSIPGLGRSPGEGNGNPTPVLLPGESHGWRSLVSYSLRGHKDSDTTVWLQFLSLSGLCNLFNILLFVVFKC